MKGKKLFGPAGVQQAYLLYLQGIPDKVIEETVPVSHATLSKWKKEGNWEAKRQELITNIAKTEIQGMFESIKQGTEDAIDGLQSIKAKAREAIEREQGGLEPHKFSEATQSYFNAVELEQKLKVRGLQFVFIGEVARILQEEIEDKQLLHQIGLKLRKLVEAE
jgi:hypothetical protein